MVQMKNALGGIPVRQVMITDYRALAPSDTLGRAVELTLATSQKDFPVVSEGRVEGVLTQTDLLKALEESDRGRTVGQVMQKSFQTADVAELMDPVFRRLHECACHTLPVLAGGRLAGLVTMDNVGEFLSIRAALLK